MMAHTKILAISASPRRHGNSETMLDAVIKGIETTNHSVEKEVLAKMVYHGCLGCGKCNETGECILNDNFTDLNRKIAEADILVFATPIYFSSMCAQLKALIDRGQPFWAQKTLLKKPLFKAKKILILVCGGCKKNEKFIENIKEIFRTYLLSFNVQQVEFIFGKNIDAKGDILKYPELIEQCKEAGRKLITNLAQ